jgi:hypothetical protein
LAGFKGEVVKQVTMTKSRSKLPKIDKVIFFMNISHLLKILLKKASEKPEAVD